MRKNTLLLLCGLTAAVAGAAGLALSNRDRSVGADAGLPRPLFASLLDRVNDITRIEVRSASGAITIARPDSGSQAWTVQDKHGYRADRDRVKKSVVAMAHLKVIEPRTSKPELFARLGVEELDAAGSAAHLVSVFDQSGATLAAVLRGKTSAAAAGASTGASTGDRPDSFFARQPGAGQAWLVEGNLDAESDPMRWIDRSAPKVEDRRVMAVTIAQPDGRAVTASRAAPEDIGLTATGLPAGRAPKQTDIDGLTDALGYLYFDDVAPADPARFSTGAVTTTVRTFDGLVVTVQVLSQNNDNWLRFDATVDAERARTAAAAKAAAAASKAAAPPPAKDGAEAKAQPAAGEPASTAPAATTPPATTPEVKPEALVAAVEAEAARLHQDFNGWMYKVSNFSAEKLAKTPEALSEEAKADATTDAPAAPEASPPAPLGAAGAPADAATDTPNRLDDGGIAPPHDTLPPQSTVPPAEGTNGTPAADSATAPPRDHSGAPTTGEKGAAEDR